MERFSGKREITISTWVWRRWTWKPESSKASMIKPRWFSSFVAEDTQPSVISIQARHTHLLSVTHPLFPQYLLLLVPADVADSFSVYQPDTREKKKPTKLWFKSLWWFFTYVSSRRLLGETEYFLYPCMPALCSGSLSLPVWLERAADGGAAEAAEEAKEAEWKCGLKCEQWSV